MPLAFALRAAGLLAGAPPGAPVRRGGQFSERERRMEAPADHEFARALEKTTRGVVAAAFAASGAADVSSLCPPEAWGTPAVDARNEWTRVGGSILARFLDRVITAKFSGSTFAPRLARDAAADRATLGAYARECRRAPEGANARVDADVVDEATKHVGDTFLRQHNDNATQNNAIADAVEAIEGDEALAVGDFVTLVGLKTEWSMNGRSGFATKVGANGRLHVVVRLDFNDSSKTRTIAVKRENARLAEADEIPVCVVAPAIGELTRRERKFGSRASSAKLGKIEEITKAVMEDRVDPAAGKLEMARLFPRKLFRAAVRAQFAAPDEDVAANAAAKAARDRARAFAEPGSKKSGAAARVGKQAAAGVAPDSTVTDLFRGHGNSLSSPAPHSGNAAHRSFYDAWTALPAAKRRKAVEKALVKDRPRDALDDDRGDAMDERLSERQQARIDWCAKVSTAFQLAVADRDGALLADLLRVAPLARLLRRAARTVRVAHESKNISVGEQEFVTTAFASVTMACSAFTSGSVTDRAAASRACDELTRGDAAIELWQCCETLAAFSTNIHDPAGPTAAHAKEHDMMDSLRSSQFMGIQALSTAVSALSMVVTLECDLRRPSAVVAAAGGLGAAPERALACLVPLAARGSPTVCGQAVAVTLGCFLQRAFTLGGYRDVLGASRAARREYLNEGILAFVVAAAHEDCADPALVDGGDFPRDAYVELVQSCLEHLQLVAAQHGSFAVAFGAHAVAGSIVAGDHKLVRRLRDGPADRANDDRVVGAALELLANLGMYGDAGIREAVARAGCVARAATYFVARAAAAAETYAGPRFVLDARCAHALNQAMRFLSMHVQQALADGTGALDDGDRAAVKACHAPARDLARRAASSGPPEQTSLMRHALGFLDVDVEPDEDLACAMSVVDGDRGRAFSDGVVLQNAFQLAAKCVNAAGVPKNYETLVTADGDATGRYKTARDEGWGRLMKVLPRIKDYLDMPAAGGGATALMQTLAFVHKNPGKKLEFRTQAEMNDRPGDAGINFAQPDAAAVESDKAAAFGLVCANCGSSEAAPGVKLQRCTGCKDVVYCDKRCARRNWKRHKPNCKAKAPK